MDKEECKTIVKMLKASYTTDSFIPDQESFMVWYAILQNYPMEVVQKSVIKYVTTQHFPPTIADIIQGIGDDESWSEHWDIVMRAVRKYGSWDAKGGLESLSEKDRTIAKRLGWHTLCTTENIGVERANFRTMFEELTQKERNTRTLEIVGGKQCLQGGKENLLNTTSN